MPDRPLRPSPHSVRGTEKRQDPTIERRQPLVTGHFFEQAAYRVERPRGLNEDWLVMLTVSGRGLLQHENGQAALLPGSVVLLKPGAPHVYATAAQPGEWELLWAHFRPPADWLNWLNWPELSPGAALLSLDAPDVREQVQRQLADCHSILSGYHARRHLLATQVLALALLWCDQQTVAQRQALDQRVIDAADSICRHLDQPLTLADMAEHCKLSPSRLRHLFAEQMNISPQQFQEQQRMVRARQLLQVSNHSVADVAYQVGYEDPFYFSTRFKRFTGQSPRQFRDQFGQ